MNKPGVLSFQVKGRDGDLSESAVLESIKRPGEWGKENVPTRNIPANLEALTSSCYLGEKRVIKKKK